MSPLDHDAKYLPKLPIIGYGMDQPWSDGAMLVEQGFVLKQCGLHAVVDQS